MSSLNRMFIVGRLGGDPELKQISGKALCKLSVATTEKWMKDGQPQEKTEWHRIEVWGKQAENCAKFLVKGDRVHVEGKLQTKSWEDANNVTRYTTSVLATSVLFFDKNRTEEKSDGIPF